MFKSKGQNLLIIFLFLATNALYFFAQRDTRQLEKRYYRDNTAAQLTDTNRYYYPGAASQ